MESYINLKCSDYKLTIQYCNKLERLTIISLRLQIMGLKLYLLTIKSSNKVNEDRFNYGCVAQPLKNGEIKTH